MLSTNIVLNSVRRHRLASLLSFCSQLFQLPKHRFKLRHKTPFSHPDFIFSQQCQLRKHRFKFRQEAPFSYLDFKFSQQCQLPKHRFKLRQKAPFSYLDFIGFPISSANFQNIVLNCARRHRLATLISIFLSSPNFYWNRLIQTL